MCILSSALAVSLKPWPQDLLLGLEGPGLGSGLHVLAPTKSPEISTNGTNNRQHMHLQMYMSAGFLINLL